MYFKAGEKTSLKFKCRGVIKCGRSNPLAINEKGKRLTNNDFKNHQGGIPFSGSQMNCIKLCQWGKINIRMVQRN